MSVIVALKARAGQYIFCEQVVGVNQEQSYFGYNKLYTLVNFLGTIVTFMVTSSSLFSYPE